MGLIINLINAPFFFCSQMFSIHPICFLQIIFAEYVSYLKDIHFLLVFTVKKSYHNYCWNQTFFTHLRDFLAVYYMKIIVYHLFCHIHLVRPQCCNIFLNYFMGILLYFQKHDLHTAKIQIIALCYLIFSLSGCSAVIGDLLRKQQKP